MRPPMVGQAQTLITTMPLMQPVQQISMSGPPPVLLQQQAPGLDPRYQQSIPPRSTMNINPMSQVRWPLQTLTHVRSPKDLSKDLIRILLKFPWILWENLSILRLSRDSQENILILTVKWLSRDIMTWLQKRKPC